MKIKLMYDSDLSWHTEKIISVQDNISESDIESMFRLELGIPYNKYDCRYEAIDGHIFSQDEVLAYSE
jgi:hypothetical protein